MIKTTVQFALAIIHKKINWKKNVYVLSFANACTAASYTMLVPFLPIYLLDLGAPPELVTFYAGAVFSVTFLIAALMAPVWGKMADSRGKKVMAIRACAGLTITYLLGGLVISPGQLFGMRVLQGFANGFLPMVLAISSASAPKEKLGYALGIAQTGQIIGMVIGPLVGGIVAHLFGMRMSFFLAGGFLLFVTLLVAFFVYEPTVSCEGHTNAATIKEGSIWDDFRYAAHNRTIVLMLALSFIISMNNLVLQPIISLYIADLQQSMDNVIFMSGVVFSLGGVAGALSTTFWGEFGQRHGYYLVISLAFLGGGLFNFLQYYPATVLGFGILQFFFGLFFVGANPAVSAMLVRATSADFRGRIFGLATTANQSGAMAGPIVGSMLCAFFGMRQIFLLTGAFLFILGLFIWRKHQKYAFRANEKRGRLREPG